MENKEYQITYLMGAGASQRALPVTSQIPAALDNFTRAILDKNNQLPESEFFEFKDIIGKTVKEYKGKIQKEFYEILQWLQDEVRRHISIDTLAKKLYVTQRGNDFLKLKIALSCFFVYIQIKRNVDLRYDGFIANLINTEGDLPKNLKILSWNYDFQFEKTYSAYSLNPYLSENQTRLNVHPSENMKSGINQFAIFKLNGTTAIHDKYFPTFNTIVKKLDEKADKNFIEKLINTYFRLTRNYEQSKILLTFAWEENDISRKVINNALISTKETDVLIVIGYSFPFFNREIDRKLIRAMPKLRQVYFQAPGEEALKYIDRFRSIREDIKDLRPEPIRDVEQFFLPPEL